MSLLKWSQANRLELNVGNSTLLHFKSENKEHLDLQPTQKTDTKFLGTLDTNFTRTELIKSMLLKIRSICCVLRYVSDKLPLAVFFDFRYNARDSKKVYTCQKRIIRLILKLD